MQRLRETRFQACGSGVHCAETASGSKYGPCLLGLAWGRSNPIPRKSAGKTTKPGPPDFREHGNAGRHGDCQLKGMVGILPLPTRVMVTSSTRGQGREATLSCTDGEDAVTTESCMMPVSFMNSPPVPELAPSKMKGGGVETSKLRANGTAPKIVDSHRSCGANSSLELSSRNGVILPVAATAKGRVLSIRGSVIDVVFAGDLPGLHEALKVANGRQSLILEVEQLLAPNGFSGFDG